jgi:ankyrin repeat protein
LNVAKFTDWFDETNDGEWVKEEMDQIDAGFHPGRDSGGRTVLHFGMRNKVPAVVIQLLRLNSLPISVCSSYLEQGPDLNVAMFAAWFGANNDGKWIKEKDAYGWTLLHIGMEYKVPAEAIKLLIEAWPQAVKNKEWEGNAPLHIGMKYHVPVEVIQLLVDAWPASVKVKNQEGNTLLHIGMWSKAPAEAIKLLVDAWPESVNVKNNPNIGGERPQESQTPLQLGMELKAPRAGLEVVRHPSQPLWASFLKQGPAMDTAEFAAWFGKRRWVAKSKDQHGTTPLELATRHKVSAAVLELLRAAQAATLTTKTLAGDTLHLRGWEDAWGAPGANLADALVSENPVGLQGVHGDEMEPVRLNPTTMELSPAVLFRPWVAVVVRVVGVGGGGGAPTITLSVRLALEGGTVGYARHKIGVLVGVVGKEFEEFEEGRAGAATHVGRLWIVRSAGDCGGMGKRKLQRSEDDKLLQAVGVGGGGGAGAAASLVYERHRTWKGLFKFAPKYEQMGCAAEAGGGWGAPPMQRPEGEEPTV